jgi:hypothetical protein
MKKKHEQYLTDRDVCLLHFLWKWKVFTTAGLAAKFFNGSAIAAYNRLSLLKKGGYVTLQYLSMKHKYRVWTLHKKGFDQILNELPVLKNQGYASEAPQHDLYSAALHLGEWLLDVPQGLELVTEQELRNNFQSNYPSWVPDIQRHRPDGFWCLPDEKGNVVFALEVELNVKTRTEYAPIVRFYRDTDEIRRIIWLVSRHSHAEELVRRFKEVAPENYKRHEFVVLSDFVKLGWQAPIVRGLEQGRTLRNVLTLGHGSDVVVPLNSSGSYQSTTTLDARVCPYKSTRYGRLNNFQISNSMALQPYPNKPLTEQE